MSDIMETIKARHSVRAYTDQPIDDATRAKLEELIVRLHFELGAGTQNFAWENPL